jgi:hypothetical protein
MSIFNFFDNVQTSVRPDGCPKKWCPESGHRINPAIRLLAIWLLLFLLSNVLNELNFQMSHSQLSPIKLSNVNQLSIRIHIMYLLYIIYYYHYVYTRLYIHNNVSLGPASSVRCLRVVERAEIFHKWTFWHLLIHMNLRLN